MGTTNTKLYAQHESRGYFYKSKTYQEVFDDIEKILKEEGLYPDEYLTICQNLPSKYALFPEIIDMHCYAEWGNSEGIYLNVVLGIFNSDLNEYQWIRFFTGKSLEESQASFERMQYIGGYIYLLFMGNRQIHPHHHALNRIPYNKDALERKMQQDLIGMKINKMI